MRNQTPTEHSVALPARARRAATWLLLAAVSGCGASDAVVLDGPMAGNPGQGMTASPTMNSPAGSAGMAAAPSGGRTATAGTPSSPVVAGMAGTTAAGTTASAGQPSAAPAGMAGSGAAPAGMAGSGAAPAGMAGSGAAPAAGGCRAAHYTLASRTAVEVSWTETIGIVSGGGTMYFWHLVKVDRSGDSLALEHRSCGFQVPEMMGSAVAGGLRILQEVRTESFESPAMPKAVGKGRSSDAMLLLEPGPLIIGLTLADSLGPWPSAVAMAGTPLDPDGDAKPGLTMFPKGGDGYSRPPINITQTDRAAQLYGTSRLVFSVAAPDPDCGDKLEGTANVTFLDQLIVGCHTESGAECTTRDADFIDQARPKMVPGKATWSGQVVPDTASCLDVRNALVMPGT